MSLLSAAMLCVFLVAWCVGLCAWLYTARFLIPWWLAGVAARFGFQRPNKHKDHLRKATKGAGVFVAACITGLIVGSIASVFGGGWH